ncbi:hypothetical protein CGZ95_19350 [Enemella evansiae]|uniref:hypothetical protein n=1 Tax=Enemella evansiae TaxID=2016499 RepID=UPI000B96BADA|nr:hypothetical protein [Enemella evansiae]OYN93497.1 hypothetical protein CGZ95_19350 [Enemella evansiae]
MTTDAPGPATLSRAQLPRITGLVLGWIAVLSLTMPWVAKWQPSLTPRRLPDQAYGFWLATEIFDDRAAAGMLTAVALPLGTVAILVLLYLAARRPSPIWPGLAVAGIALALLILARVGIELYVPEETVGDLFVRQPGWYLWQAAMAGCLIAGLWIVVTHERPWAGERTLPEGHVGGPLG